MDGNAHLVLDCQDHGAVCLITAEGRAFPRMRGTWWPRRGQFLGRKSCPACEFTCDRASATAQGGAHGTPGRTVGVSASLPLVPPIDEK